MVACLDQGAGNDQEVLGLVFHQDPTFINASDIVKLQTWLIEDEDYQSKSIHAVGNMGVMICHYVLFETAGCGKAHHKLTDPLWTDRYGQALGAFTNEHNTPPPHELRD